MSVSAGANHSAGSSYFQGQRVPFAGDPWSYRRGYDLFVTLFDGGQRWFNYGSAQATLKASAENEVLLRYTVALA